MREVIKQWLSKRGFVASLCHKRVESLFTYEVWDYLGTDDKFHSFNVVYSDTRIIGGLSSLSAVSIGTSEEISGAVYDVDYILDSLVRSYSNRDEYSRNKSKVITKDQLDLLVRKHLHGLLQSVYSITIGGFMVTDVKFPSMQLPMMIVKFSWEGKHEIPFALTLGEPSLIKRRNYGEGEREFTSFVESIGEVTGGIVWY